MYMHVIISRLVSRRFPMHCYSIMNKLAWELGYIVTSILLLVLSCKGKYVPVERGRPRTRATGEVRVWACAYVASPTCCVPHSFFLLT